MQLEEYRIRSNNEELLYVVATSESNSLRSDKPIALIPSCRVGWDALEEYPYNAFPDVLFASGFRIVTWMCPNHGDRIGNQQHSELAGFAESITLGDDPFQTYVINASDIVSDLINKKIAKIGSIYTLGGSRTGYLVLRHMAEDARVSGGAVACPVTDWGKLDEFKAIKDSDAVKRASLENFADQLSSRPIFGLIGNYDPRVSTEAALSFFQKVITSKNRGTNSLLSFHLVPSDGHSLGDEHWIAAARFIVELPVSDQIEKISDLSSKGLIWIRGAQASLTVRDVFGVATLNLNNGMGISFEISDNSGELVDWAMLYCYSTDNYCIRVNHPYTTNLMEALKQNDTHGSIIEDHSKCFNTIGLYGDEGERLIASLPWKVSPLTLLQGQVKDIELEGYAWAVVRTTEPYNKGFEITGNKDIMGSLKSRLQEI